MRPAPTRCDADYQESSNGRWPEFAPEYFSPDRCGGAPKATAKVASLRAPSGPDARLQLHKMRGILRTTQYPWPVPPARKYLQRDRGLGVHSPASCPPEPLQRCQCRRSPCQYKNLLETNPDRHRRQPPNKDRSRQGRKRLFGRVNLNG